MQRALFQYPHRALFGGEEEETARRGWVRSRLPAYMAGRAMSNVCYERCVLRTMCTTYDVCYERCVLRTMCAMYDVYHSRCAGREPCCREQQPTPSHRPRRRAHLRTHLVVRDQGPRPSLAFYCGPRPWSLVPPRNASSGMALKAPRGASS